MVQFIEKQNNSTGGDTQNFYCTNHSKIKETENN